MTDVVNATETFYPSCVVNFNMVFERRLMVREDGATNEALRAEDNSGVFVMQRVPKKCSVELQGHVQAATFKLTFDYTELPVDPRTVAAASVEIHMGTVSKRDFSNGIQRTMNNQGWRRSQLVTRNERGEAIEDNLVMVGVVDEWSVEHGENGSEVHLSGRDLRGILLDSPLVTPRDRGQLQTGTQARSGGRGRQPSRRKRRTTILDRLNTTLDIVQLVTQILSEHDGLMRFRQPILVETDLAWWPFGRIPSPGEASRVPRHRRGAGGGGGAAGAGASGMNFWDVITRYCQPADALVCKSDLTWVPISEIKVGDRLLGYAKDADTASKRRHHKYTDAEVQEVFVRKAPVVALHMASGRVVRCTPDHHWFTGRSEPKYEFAMPAVGRDLIRVFDNPCKAKEATIEYKLGYARGLIEGDGSVIDRTYFHEDGKKKCRTKGIFLAMNDEGALNRYKAYLSDLGIGYTEGIHRSGPGLSYEQKMVRSCTQKALDVLVFAPEPTDSEEYMRGWLAGIFDAEGCTSNGLEICQIRRVNPDTWDKIRRYLEFFEFRVRSFADRIKVHGGAKELMRFFDLVQPAAVFKFRNHILGMRMTGTKDRIVRIEELGEEDVYSLKTSTGTYMGQGYASRNCYLVGAIPTFVGRSLVIRPAFNLFQQIQRQEFITAFRPNGQRSDGNESWGIRRLVWGRDIKDLKLSRKYTGKNKPRTVRCISYRVTRESRGHEAFIEVFYPPRNRRDARRQHNRADEIAGQESEQIDTVPVPDAVNEEQLLACARSLYEMRGRNEMAGSFEVEKPTSYAGANSDPDMLRLRVGDPVELLVDASRFAGDSPITSTLNRTRQLPFDAAVEELKKLLGDTNLCRAIVGSSRGNIMGVLAYFRVSSVSFDFSDDGIKIKADIQNYWTPKYDVEAQNRDRTQPHRQVASQRVQRTVTRAGGETAAQNGTAASSSGLQMQPIDAPQLRTVPVNTAATAGHNNYVSAWRRNHGAGPTPEAARRVENLENDTSGGSRWRE